MTTTTDALAVARQHYLAGRLAEAEAACRVAVEAEPLRADAAHLLGVVAHRAGRSAVALEWLGRAADLDPTNAEIFYNLGVANQFTGRHADAADSYQESIRLNPGRPEVHNNLGYTLLGLGRLDEALAAFDEALRLRPDFPEALANRGEALIRASRLDEAAGCLRKALDLRPEFPEALNHLGVVLREQRQQAAAEDCFHRALRVRPDYAAAHNNLGRVCEDLGRHDLAEARFRLSLAYQPNDATVHTNLANHLVTRGRAAEALPFHRRAVELRPTHAVLHSNLAHTLTLMGRPDEAEAACREALRLQPDLADAHHNLAITLAAQGRFVEAVASNHSALRLQPEHAGARNCRALWWLQSGEFDRGWPEYEWRWKLRGVAARNLPQPLWDGQELGGRTVVVYAEQALGDTLQFARYVPLVRARGGRVVLECQPPLEPLLRTLAGVNQLVPRGTTLPDADFQVPLLSLPRVFGTTPDTIPAAVPYLSAETERVARWREELNGPEFKVGLAWQGSPSFPGDRLRSIPLTQFAPLGRVDGVRFYSLQKGPGREQLRDLPTHFRVTDLSERLDSDGAFLDTAAVMRCLDLVVTSDTAVAHLAGALGVRVWVAVSIGPDWRWMIDREDCPWYPTMRLFRQRRLHEWGEVFERMATELDSTRPRRGTSVAVPVAVGELIDKITILEIKERRLTDPGRLRNVRTELAVLRECSDRELPPSPHLDELAAELREVNETLWQIEDDIRDRERSGDFGPRFVELARAVYHTNDRRAAIKRRINELVGSAIVEEKLYAGNDAAPGDSPRPHAD
ncbi:MAG TPA: DUF6165 family protein [Gemmata sp.]|nr:DUF6165 family protein [Gemmata sp.]